MDQPQFPDFRPSGNAGVAPEVYDLENRAIDPGGVLLEAMREVAPWAGRSILDLGCGTGYWLDLYADEAATVIGVEPDPALLRRAAARRPAVRVLPGSAEHLPLPDRSVEVVHARFAYFFPPGCDAGLVEVLRVLAPGGRLVVVDNDHRHGEFASLLAASTAALPQGRAPVTNRWWADRGAQRREVMSSWSFGHRADLEAVLRMEFPAAVVEPWLQSHPTATGLSYGYVLFSVRSPGYRARRPQASSAPWIRGARPVPRIHGICLTDGGGRGSLTWTPGSIPRNGVGTQPPNPVDKRTYVR